MKESFQLLDNLDTKNNFFLKGAKTMGEDPTTILLMMVGDKYNMYKEGSKWNPKDIKK
jgi:hypothetical protein